mmetsp:Transcript_31515/g.53233  ORF Transcript_31515/g.53233 Transcript_31515/m.53233 type:complete len:710 (+) Transcript_31515:42-2171(+)
MLCLQDALKTYLVYKLDHVPTNDNIRFLICSWLVELFCESINRAEIHLPSTTYDASDRLSALKREFRQFLLDYARDQRREGDKSTVDVNNTYTSIAGHGRMEEYVVFATAMEDWERVISYHLQPDQCNWKEAITALLKQSDPEVYYKFSPTLMLHAPVECVTAWTRAGKLLDPRRLIPALMRYNLACNLPGDTIHHGIRYLDYAIHTLRNCDRAVHNYLLSLYAANEDETPLINFIAHASEGQCLFDMQFALRLCSSLKKTRACIHIYSALKQYERAVDHALQIDVNLAKQKADEPEDDDELRKKLWLRIARYVIEKDHDIKRAMAFLDECKVVQLEDILPMFPHLTPIDIDDFKERAVESLDECNKRIAELNEEMDETMNTVELIRSDIKQVTERHVVVQGDMRCSLKSCGQLLFAREFYVFPCRHAFHVDCLCNEALRHLTKTDFIKVHEVLRYIKTVMAAQAADKHSKWRFPWSLGLPPTSSWNLPTSLSALSSKLPPSLSANLSAMSASFSSTLSTNSSAASASRDHLPLPSSRASSSTSLTAPPPPPPPPNLPSSSSSYSQFTYAPPPLPAQSSSSSKTLPPSVSTASLPIPSHLPPPPGSPHSALSSMDMDKDRDRDRDGTVSEAEADAEGPAAISGAGLSMASETSTYFNQHTAALAARHDLDALRDELDSLIAADCVLCGEAIIGTLDMPLTETTNSTWDL